ncbi:MAG: PDZ domain-containing protein [Deltaproteobacteria bacterium]|nr:PDZ domain-containing protein [Deltaproteobacteria bacterium]
MKKYLVVLLLLVVVILISLPLIRKDSEKGESKMSVTQKINKTRDRDLRLPEQDREKLEKLGMAVKNIRRIPFEIRSETQKEDSSEEKGVLIGLVFSTENKPVKGCVITLKDEKGYFVSARRTDMSGKFYFDNIKIGEYRLLVHCEEGRTERDKVLVEKDRVNNIQIVLNKNEMITNSLIVGNVIDFITRQPVGGALVSFLGNSDSTSGVNTDSLGRFSINVTSPQRGRLVIQKDDYVKKSIELEVREREITVNNILLVKGNIKNEGNRYQGIGAALIEKDNEFVVMQVFEGSPASKAGLKSGDRIYQINGMDINLLKLDEVIALIRGDERTNVVLTIKRGDEVKYIQIVRETIEIK